MNSSSTPTRVHHATSFATLREAFKRAGYALHDTADGYMVERWGMWREVPDEETLLELLRRVGGSL
ncbi:MAG: hypothetical protein ABI887_06765 [Burkholderiales bacterium]